MNSPMPNDPKHDSGTAVVPVAHPNGEIHQVEFPADLSIADAHSALMASGYQMPAQPTSAGAIENQQSFKDNARKLWNLVGNGKDRAEAGNFVSRTGDYSEPQREANLDSGKGQIVFSNPPKDALGVIHTHPRTGGPSDTDIQSAKNHRMTVYVIDADGLHAVDPGGQVTTVFHSVGDATKEADKQKKPWVPKYNAAGHRIN